MADGGFVGKQKHTKLFAAKKDSEHSRLGKDLPREQQQSAHQDKKKSHHKVYFLVALLFSLFSAFELNTHNSARRNMNRESRSPRVPTL